MKQTNLTNNLFRYGKLGTDTQQHSSNSCIDLERPEIKENTTSRTQYEDQSKYIKRLLSIINKQKNEITQQHLSISLLESDLKNSKKLSQEMQETLKTLSQQNEILMKQQIGDDSPQAGLTAGFTCQTSKDEKQPHFFEKFMMISAFKKDIHDVVREQKEKTLFTMKPQIIYQYPAEDLSWQTAYKAILPQMIFPYGVDTKICNKSDSLSELNEIIYSGLLPYKFDNVSVVAFKSDQSFGDSSDWLRVANPNKLLYCICLEQRDFINEEQRQTKKSKFISVSKTYVFMTKFPLITLFVDILHNFVNDLKMRKASLHCNGNMDIDQIDCEFHQVQKYQIKTYRVEIEDELEHLIGCSIQERLKFKIFSEPLDYAIPALSYHMDCDWGTYLILNILTVSQFIEILSALLSEQQVVIVSAQGNMISASMLLFNSVLMPFQWVHPFISIVSPEMMQIFDSPVPVFMGVLKDERFVIVEDLYETYDQIVFVELDGSFQDGSVVIVNSCTTTTTNSPSLKHLEQALTPYFLRLRLKKEDIITSPDEQDLKTYHDIFHTLNKFYNEDIIHHIPEREHSVHDNQIQYATIMEAVESKHHANDTFIQAFVRTQGFAYYLEQLFS